MPCGARGAGRSAMPAAFGGAAGGGTGRSVIARPPAARGIGSSLGLGSRRRGPVGSPAGRASGTRDGAPRGAGRSMKPAVSPGPSSSRSRTPGGTLFGPVDIRFARGAGSSGSSADSAALRPGRDPDRGGSLASADGRRGAGRSARSIGPPEGTGAALPDAAGWPEIATRDLQLAQFTNRAPTGTSASAIRLIVPHAVQVASIIRRNHTAVACGLRGLAGVTADRGSRDRDVRIFPTRAPNGRDRACIHAASAAHDRDLPLPSCAR